VVRNREHADKGTGLIKRDGAARSRAGIPPRAVPILRRQQQPIVSARDPFLGIYASPGRSLARRGAARRDREDNNSWRP